MTKSDLAMLYAPELSVRGALHRLYRWMHNDEALMADLLATGWTPPVRFERLPPHVFAEYRRMASGALAVHLVNYDPAHPIRGARIMPPSGLSATAEAPFEADASVHRIPADGALPAFAEYLLVTVR